MSSDNAPAAILGELEKRIGSPILLDESTLIRASMDNARLSVMPQACIRIQDEKDVGEILSLANKHNIPVTTRGAGSSTTGSATPVQGGWVLDFSELKKVQIDPVSGFAHVQPGVTVTELQAAAVNAGWFYPPDPASKDFCTIGGNIACNAGGLRAAKYGVTRDYVSALEGFLPTGEKVRWGAPLKKNTAGYNIRDLWVGSEGTLGVVTRAVIKLVPKPQSRFTCLAAFRSEEDALNAVRKLLERRMIPSVLEFLDRQTVGCTEKHTGRHIFSKCPSSAVLLIEIDGNPSSVKEDKEKLIAWAEETAIGVQQAVTDKEAEEFWNLRRICAQAMYQLGNTKLTEDVVVPLGAQIDLMEYIQDLKKKTGLPMPTFGHAADGNFHINIMYDREDASARKKAEEVISGLMKKVVEYGGSISGEHGIGLSKTPFLSLQFKPEEITAMQAVKKAFDPNNILNPGKIFTPFQASEHNPRWDVSLPWDSKSNNAESSS